MKNFDKVYYLGDGFMVKSSYRTYKQVMRDKLFKNRLHLANLKEWKANRSWLFDR